MSVDDDTYLAVFPTGYTDNNADTLRSEFIADFNAVDKKRIPDTLNAVYRLYQNVCNAYYEYVKGRIVGDFKLTWTNSYPVKSVNGPDMVNMYQFYVQAMSKKMSLLFMVADEAYGNFLRYIRLAERGGSNLDVSYVKSNQYAIDQITGL
jgi:hypothetical protein